MKNLTRGLVATFLILTFALPSRADDSGIRYILNSDKVLRVVTRVGYMTVLEFPSTLDEVYCGDTGVFAVEVVGRRAVIKALVPGARTNLIASIGSRKRYVFDLIESATEPPNYLVILIDPERGLNFAAMVETLNKGFENEDVFITDLNRIYQPQLDGSIPNVSLIRLLRDARKNVSMVWWRIHSSFAKIEERDISIEGFTRVAAIADQPGREELFARNYRDFFIIVSGTDLSDQFTLCFPWNGTLCRLHVPKESGRHYEPNNVSFQSRRLRVWVDSFVDDSTGRSIEVPGHYDLFEVMNYFERGAKE